MRESTREGRVKFTLELPPGTTYEDLGFQLRKAAMHFTAGGYSKPEHAERIEITDKGRVIGEWRIEK